MGRSHQDSLFHQHQRQLAAGEQKPQIIDRMSILAMSDCQFETSTNSEIALNPMMAKRKSTAF